MAIDVTTIALAQSYARRVAEDISGFSGSRATISSIVSIDGGNRVTFSYTDEDGNKKTVTMDVMDGKDGSTPIRGVDYWTEEDKKEIVDEVLAEVPEVVIKAVHDGKGNVTLSLS